MHLKDHPSRQFVKFNSISGGIRALNVEWGGTVFRLVPLHATIDLTQSMKKPLAIKTHAHDIYHIIIFTEGRNCCRFQGKVCAIQPGALALVSPGEQHDFNIMRPGRAVYSEITFMLADSSGRCLKTPFKQLLELYEGTGMPDVNLPAIIPLAKAKAIRAGIAEIIARLTMCPPAGQLELARQFLGLFSMIIGECYRPQIKVMVNEQPLIQKARDYIEANYTQRLKIRQLAGMAGMSAGYFFYAFKKAFGRTPIAFQQHLRIESAKTLLRYSHWRCKEIAGKVGYDDVYYFSKTFKKIAGSSPMAYRAKKSSVRPAPSSAVMRR
jgi:AraC-like DNA-binding protein